MDFVKRWINQVRVTLAELNLVTKMLIGLLSVMILASLLLVVLYAGQPDMAPVLDQPLKSDEQSRITSYLDMRSIPYRVQGSQVLVPLDRKLEALAGLQLNSLLPEDTSRGFDAMAERQTWWQSKTQNAQLYDIAKQNVLAQIIKQLPGVSDATVILSRPEQNGFGRTHKRHSASVSVLMASGRVDQKLVDAIAGLVSGSVAELQPQDVTVVADGRQWKIRSADEVMPGDYMEFVQKNERFVQQKIAAALGYIPRVIVAVNVEADITRKTTEQENFDRETSVELVTRENSRSQTTREAASGGEPGVRSNVGANIDGAVGGGLASSTEETETEFEPHAGRTHVVTQDPGGVLTRINATVNIPRSYFVGIYRRDKGDAQANPNDTELQAILTANLDRIKKQVEPLLAAQTQGDLVVDVYPDDEATGAAQLAAAGLAGGDGPLGFLGDGLVQQLALGGLALVSLAMMFLMMRRASQKPQDISAEELSGVPPSLLTEEMVIGEADEGDAALMGMELDEEQMRSRKLVKQVNELVRSNPDEVVNLVQRWAKRPE